MEPVHLNVVAFDVCDNRRRRQLTRVLEAWGVRVLESVFEAWLTDAQCRKMEQQALACILPGADRLALYTLPPTDAQDRIVFGTGNRTQDLTYTIV
jgi:CRISPR-associated protein Cas2